MRELQGPDDRISGYRMRVRPSRCGPAPSCPGNPPANRHGQPGTAERAIMLAGRWSPRPSLSGGSERRRRSQTGDHPAQRRCRVGSSRRPKHVCPLCAPAPHDREHIAQNAPESTVGLRVSCCRRDVRNEKVRGSSPLSSTPPLGLAALRGAPRGIGPLRCWPPMPEDPST
jgi:hypothetical protein